MIMLTVLNTASLQLIPATAAALRTACGAERPMEILPCVWIVSVYSLTVAVTAAKLMARFSRRRVPNADN
jgi:spore maturation protein A